MGLDDDLRAMLATRAGTWGVYARHLDTGETVAIRADEVMPAQSSVKVCVLLAYTKRIRLGNDERDRRVTLLSEDHEMGSGVLRYLAPGLSPTLDDLAWMMIVLSDNIATRALIRELGGREIVNAEMDALGRPHQADGRVRDGVHRSHTTHSRTGRGHRPRRPCDALTGRGVRAHVRAGVPGREGR